MKRRVAVVQARMGSSRFPGKMMALLGGRPMVDYVLARLSRSRDAGVLDGLVLATSNRPADDPLARHVADRWPDVRLVRGPEDDVLGRFLVALEVAPADTVVRVTGDCPLVNTEHLPRLISEHEAAGADVTNYRPGFEYVDKGVEVVSSGALHAAAGDPDLTARDREHVTALFYRRPERYRVHYTDSAPYLRRGDLRLTVDTPEDLAFFEALVQRLDDDLARAALSDVIDVLDRHPELAERNAHAGRKSTLHEARRVGFRCDGGPEIGLGHVVGCLRLADSLARARGVGIEFVVRDEPSAVRLIQRHGFAVEVLPADATPEADVSRLLEKSRESDWSAVVVNFCKADIDRYTPLFPRLRERGPSLVFMDNPVPPSYLQGDLVVNALPHPDYDGYDPAGHFACYDGLEYLLLDDRFRPYQDVERAIGEDVGRVLIAMGGGDQPNATGLVLEGLSQAGFEGFVDVVLGGANPHEREVRARFERLALRGRVGVAVDDLPARMEQADVGFSALGLTTYEMAYMGLPVLLVSTTPFNAGVADLYCARQEGAVHLGLCSEVSPSQIAEAVRRLSPSGVREAMSRAQRRAVDGRGAERVLDAFNQVLSL